MKAPHTINIRVAGLSPPQGFDTKSLVRRLNKLQTYYQFSYVGSSPRMDRGTLPRGQHSVDQLAKSFHEIFPDSGSFPYEIALTGVKIEDGYFTALSGHLGLISSAETGSILDAAGKSLEKFFAFNLIETVIWLQYNHEHDKDDADDGCLFDSCYYDRDHAVLGLRKCAICDDCKETLDKLPPEQMKAVEKVLQWVRQPHASVVVVPLLSLSLIGAGLPIAFYTQFPVIGWGMLTLSGWIISAPDAIHQMLLRVRGK